MGPFAKKKERKLFEKTTQKMLVRPYMEYDSLTLNNTRWVDTTLKLSIIWLTFYLFSSINFVKLVLIAYHPNWRVSPRVVVAIVPDCDLVISESELQSLCYVLFRINTPGERYEPPYLFSYGLNSTSSVLLWGWLWHSATHECWYAIKKKKPTTIIIEFICFILTFPSLSLTLFVFIIYLSMIKFFVGLHVTLPQDKKRTS